MPSALSPFDGDRRGASVEPAGVFTTWEAHRVLRPPVAINAPVACSSASQSDTKTSMRSGGAAPRRARMPDATMARQRRRHRDVLAKLVRTFPTAGGQASETGTWWRLTTRAPSPPRSEGRPVVRGARRGRAVGARGIPDVVWTRTGSRRPQHAPTARAVRYLDRGCRSASASGRSCQRPGARRGAGRLEIIGAVQGAT
jgi:hypothetical protein